MQIGGWHQLANSRGPQKPTFLTCKQSGNTDPNTLAEKIIKTHDWDYQKPFMANKT